MKWLRLTEYAKRYGVTQSAIYSALASGRLRDNGKRGRDRRVDGGVDIRSTRGGGGDEFTLRLTAAKLRKAEAETRLLEQRSERWRRLMIEETAEIFLRAFESSFGSFRSLLVDLKLPAESLRQLQDCFGECLGGFRADLERELEKRSDGGGRDDDERD